MKMDKQTSKIVVEKILQNCDIKSSSIIQKTQSCNIEIHITKNPQEKDWLTIEDIIAKHNLKLRIKNNLIIY